MKKFIYIALLTLVSGMAITSCTEESVTPKKQDTSGAGGQGSDPVR